MSSSSSTLAPIERIERDIKKAAATLGRDEARFLVDTYYALQDFRIASSNQVRSIAQSEEPHETLGFFSSQFKELERQIHNSLDVYSNASELGSWARLHVGVGPVIAAGLLAHIDIERAPSASSIWRFAGLAPNQRKQKGVKRDWNARLKVLAWKLGDSFVKFSGREDCYYGRLYRERKVYELERDASLRSIPVSTLSKADIDALVREQDAVILQDNVLLGGNAKVAQKTLEMIQIKDPATRQRYESGHLPDGRLDMRARRFAVKRFLAHYFEAAWRLHYKTVPPNPYVQEHLGHVHIEPCPIPMP